MQIHIISLNVPYPANYGGVIDIFYKIKSLHEAGVQIHLHCFDYGRGNQPELEKYCNNVTYHQRKTGFSNSLSQKPFIVKSRNDNHLLELLLTTDYPILFEGLHTTLYLDHPLLKNRIKIVRAHNVEHEYYRLLAEQERTLFKRYYFKKEASKLARFESILRQSNAIAAISPNDYRYFNEKYGKTFLLPPFHSNSGITSTIGLSDFALYHGDLSVRENIESALFLIRTFKNKDIKIVFAGKNPSKEITKSMKGHPNLILIPNPTEIEISKLRKTAQVHLLPTFQPTGIKLKLIASLFEGRHCLVNSAMIKGTGLETLCHLANTSEEFENKTRKLMMLPFEDKDLLIRKEILTKNFNNARNAQIFVDELNLLKQIIS